MLLEKLVEPVWCCMWDVWVVCRALYLTRSKRSYLPACLSATTFSRIFWLISDHMWLYFFVFSFLVILSSMSLPTFTSVHPASSRRSLVLSKQHSIFVNLCCVFTIQWSVVSSLLCCCLFLLYKTFDSDFFPSQSTESVLATGNRTFNATFC